MSASELLRNIAVVGHGQTGKTSLVSAFLFDTKMVNRLGKVDQGNTVTDYEEDEIEKKVSVQAALAHAVHRKHRLNLVDTPGFANFIWESRVALTAADMGLIVVCGQEGVGVQTEKVFDYAEELKKPVVFVLNRLGKELADFDKALDTITSSFGKDAVPLFLPVGVGKDFKGVVDLLRQKAYIYGDDEKGEYKEGPVPAELADDVATYREELIEKIAECDETLMEKYLEEGALSDEELQKGLRIGILNRGIFPVLAADAYSNKGVMQVLDFLVDFGPSPLDMPETPLAEGSLKVDPNGPFAGFVFKTISDPYTGKITIIRVYSGTLKPDTSYANRNKDTEERIGSLFLLQGKTQNSLTEGVCGDIVAVAKLKETQTGDTLTIKGQKIMFPALKFPIPSISFAIEPKARGDEGKISNAFQRIMEEDPTVHTNRDMQTHELVISGNGQLHVELVVGKLKKKYGVEVDMKPPKIPYLETIKGKSDINYKHKKQSGGRGQYGHVLIKFEPLPRGEDFVFEDTIFGGSIPKNYVPAIEKGIQESRPHGVIAGYPMVDFKANVYDGSYHDVDSSDMAFKIAATMAFKKGMKAASPTILEPVMKVDVVIPEEFMGDINGTLSGRRGRILGMEAKGKNHVVKATVPMSEMLDFEPTLTSITGGRGSYSMELSHYEEVPGHLQKKIIEDSIREGRIREEEE